MQNHNKGIFAWHFLDYDAVLEYGDSREVIIGQWMHALTCNYGFVKKPEICEQGMHASRRVEDAYSWSMNCKYWLCRVKVWGNINEEPEKLVGLKRKVLYVIDASDIVPPCGYWTERQWQNWIKEQHKIKTQEEWVLYKQSYQEHGIWSLR